MRELIERKDCPMRHENGNCMVAGGFCTAVNDPICEALHDAYDCGQRSVSERFVPIEDMEIIIAEVKKRAVKHGRWVYEKTYQGMKYVCSECGEIPECFEPNYCPNCGARMDGE